MNEPLSVLTVLLLIYAGAVTFNALLSGLLFARQRDPLTRGQLLIWVATLVALVAQGVAGGTAPGVYLGLVSVFLVSAAVAHVLSLVVGLQVQWRQALLILATGAGGTLICHALAMPFSLTALPLLIGVAWPMLSTASRALASGSARLSPTAQGMVVASLLYGLHQLDFALLGDQPEFAPVGFSLSLLFVFALSIFTPAVVMEQLSARTARTAAEMDAARRIQTQLLPRAPEVPDLDLVCYMRPAEEVGGDYYDIQHASDRTWMLMGDVTGHGLSSGLVMLMAQSVMSAILHVQGDMGPGRLNLLANRILHENLGRMGEERTMTILSICKLGADDFVLCGAHDNLYIHRRGTGEVEVLEASQFPFQLGLVDDIPEEMVEELRFRLDPGDTLFLVTDGVTEAAREGDYRKGLYDEERLMAFIRQTADRPLSAVRDGLNEELERFTRGVFHDDVTFIIARRQEA